MKKILVCLALAAAGALMISNAPDIGRKAPEECRPKEQDVRSTMAILRSQGHSGQELIDLTASISKIPCDLERRANAHQPTPLPPALQTLIKK
jgi:hypothetical protein